MLDIARPRCRLPPSRAPDAKRSAAKSDALRTDAAGFHLTLELPEPETTARGEFAVLRHPLLDNSGKTVVFVF